MWLPKKWI